MENEYTVCLFGHRQLTNPRVIEEQLEQMITDLVRRHPSVRFLIGRDGDFDLLAASVIRRVCRRCGQGNTCLTLVLPYSRAEYRNNLNGLLACYDEVEICQASAKVYYKAAFPVRNRSMIDRADLLICYVERDYGGAYQALTYAKKRGVPTLYLSSYPTQT